MTVDDDAFVRFSKGGFALLCLGLLVAIFGLLRDDAGHRAKQAKAAESAAASQRQRTKDNASYMEAQARSLADLDALANQLSAAGITPAVSAQQAIEDSQPRPAPVFVSPVRSNPTTTTSTTTPRRGSPGTTAPPQSPTTTSPPTTRPPSPPPSQPCVTLPAVGPIPGVSVCASPGPSVHPADRHRMESSSAVASAGLGGGPLILIVIVVVLLAAAMARDILE